MHIGIATIATTMIFMMLWMYFSQRAERLLIELSIEYNAAKYGTSATMDLVQLSSRLIAEHLSIFIRDDMTPEEKDEATKKLSDEINAINGVLAPYYRLESLASFCIWATIFIMPIGTFLTLLVFGPNGY